MPRLLPLRNDFRSRTVGRVWIGVVEPRNAAKNVLDEYYSPTADLRSLTRGSGRNHQRECGGLTPIAAPNRGTEAQMSSRGTSLGVTARNRKSLVFFWIALFVLSIALQYTQFSRPSAVKAASGLLADTVS